MRKNIRRISKGMMKYLPVDEIMQALEQFMEAEETAQREEILPDEKPETKVIAVYSPLGGCGKSLVAMALGQKLKKLDQSVLVIGCDSLQSIAAYLSCEDFADEKLAEQLKEPVRRRIGRFCRTSARKKFLFCCLLKKLCLLWALARRRCGI